MIIHTRWGAGHWSCLAGLVANSIGNSRGKSYVPGGPCQIQMMFTTRPLGLPSLLLRTTLPSKYHVCTPGPFVKPTGYDLQLPHGMMGIIDSRVGLVGQDHSITANPLMHAMD